MSAARATRQAVLAVDREALERAIETAIAALDELDGDLDLEPDVDDEDGGDGHPGSLRGLNHLLGPGDDTDVECEGDLEMDLENEPSACQTCSGFWQAAPVDYDGWKR